MIHFMTRLTSSSCDPISETFQKDFNWLKMSIASHDKMSLCATFLCSASVSSAFVLIYTVCDPYCLSVKYILGQWLCVTAEIRLLEVELLLYQYASLSPALHWLCSHMGNGISNRSVWTKKWVETWRPTVPLAVELFKAKYSLAVGF